MQPNKASGGGGGGGTSGNVYNSQPSGTIKQPTAGIRPGNLIAFKDPGSYVPANVRRQ